MKTKRFNALMKTKRFYDPQFYVDCLFVWDCGDEELRSYVLAKFETNLEVALFDGGCFTVGYKTKSKGAASVYVLWIRQNIQLYHLAHECLHLAVTLLKDCGALISYENQETIAYVYTYWFKKLWSAMAAKEKDESIS